MYWLMQHTISLMEAFLFSQWVLMNERNNYIHLNSEYVLVKTEDFEFLVRTVKNTALLYHSHQYRPDTLIADNAVQITNGWYLPLFSIWFKWKYFFTSLSILSNKLYFDINHNFWQISQFFVAFKSIFSVPISICLLFTIFNAYNYKE